MGIELLDKSRMALASQCGTTHFSIPLDAPLSQRATGALLHVNPALILR